MLQADLYGIVYLVVIVALTVFCIFKYSQYSVSRLNFVNSRSNNIPSVILVICLIFFIGFRPLSYVFVDMMNYNDYYNVLQAGKDNFQLSRNNENYIFSNLFNFFAANSFDVYAFFLCMAAIYFFCIFWAVKRIFPNDCFYSLVIYLGALSTFSYATNGLKAGAAASIFLLCFAYYKKPLLVILFSLISLGFHHSMTLPIVGFVSAYIIRNPKWFFIFWILCLVISSLQINGLTTLLSQFTDEGGQEYLLGEGLEDWGGKTGFRWDFILYSLPPILIGFWSIYRHGVIDRLFQILLCSYLFVNGIWLVCMYVPFNNRIAYLSWFMLPIVSIYPFFKLKLETRQYIQLNYIVSMFLGFTIFAFLLL